MRRPGSLKHALTREMIILQLLVLIIFGVLISIPIADVAKNSQNLDDSIVEHITEAVFRNSDGSLQMGNSWEISDAQARFPNFWFIAENETGNTLRFGKAPVDAARNVGDITRISSADITDTGNPDAPMAIVRTGEGPAGKLWILTAGGPTLGNTLLLEVLSSPYFISLAIIITIVSLLAVPVLVGRQLRGVEHMAKQADVIDINQPGVRLAAATLPSEIRPLVNAFNAALIRLDEGVVRQRKFMADASHELRTPIAILQARLELPGGALDRKQLLLDVARLANLANQLLDLQRLEILSPSFEALELVELVADVSAELAPLAITAGTDMSFQADIDSYMFLGDRGSFSRALTNVMQNALVHGGKSGRIHINVMQTGAIRIEDSGPGIPHEDRAGIFEPFHRLSSDGKGAGLGLHLVKDIVQRHGGRIIVSDSETGGACFEIFVPPMPPAINAFHTKTLVR